METETKDYQLMFSALYACVGVLGIAGNSLTFLIFWRERSRCVFHLQLAVANIITLTSTSLSAPSALKGRWLFGDFLCQWYGFQVFISGFVGIAMTSVICIETYMAVCGTNKKEGPSKAVSFTVSAMVWGYALLFSLAPLFGWNAYKIDSLGTSCGIDINNNTTSNYSYLIATQTAFNMLVLPAIVCLVLALFRKSGDIQVFQPLLSNKELVRVTFLLFLVLVLGCLPYYLRVVSFLRGFPSFFDSSVGVELSHVAIKAGCLLQPVVYIFVSEKFRSLVISTVTGSDAMKKNA